MVVDLETSPFHCQKFLCGEMAYHGSHSLSFWLSAFAGILLYSFHNQAIPACGVAPAKWMVPLYVPDVSGHSNSALKSELVSFFCGADDLCHLCWYRQRLILPSQGKQNLLGKVETELSTMMTLTQPYPGGGDGSKDTSTRSLLSAGLESSHASGTSKSSDSNYWPSSESTES